MLRWSRIFWIISRGATCEAPGEWTCHTNITSNIQHTNQHPRHWGSTTVQRYDNTNNRYLDIKYVSERIGNSWISAPNYLNTNSVVTACFLPSLPLTGDACSVPDTECSIFLNFYRGWVTVVTQHYPWCYDSSLQRPNIETVHSALPVQQYTWNPKASSGDTPLTPGKANLFNYHDHNIHYHQLQTEFGVKTKISGNFNRFTKIHYHFNHYTRESFRNLPPSVIKSQS